jgi:hypothetical protein
MEFEADHQPRIGAACERPHLCPVVVNLLLPLALIDVLEIGQPPAAGEMWRRIAGHPRWAAGKSDDPVDTDFAGKPDGIAQRRIMCGSDALVGMERIAPAIEGSDRETAGRDLVRPRAAGTGILEQPWHVAMARGGVGAGADLESADFRHLGHHPVQHLAERLACQRLRHQTDIGLKGSHGFTGLERSKKGSFGTPGCQASVRRRRAARRSSCQNGTGKQRDAASLRD